MLQAKLIKHSNSEWLSLINIVFKKDGSIGLTIDYRKLNNVTIKDAFQVPNIHDLLLKLHNAKVFSKIDLSSGYFQIQMQPAAAKYTAFGCELGLFEFNVMPMGLSNSMSTFDRLLTTIFGEPLGVFVIIYVDDVLIFSYNAEDHIKHIRIVIQTLAKHNLKFKLSKCDLFVVVVEFLGHLVGYNSIKPSKDRTNAIEKFKQPTKMEEVRSYIGLASFYKIFIRNFSLICAPLYD